MQLKNKILITFFLIFFSSCGNQLTRQSPERRKADRFYRLDEKRAGIIYNQRCKKLKKRERECWRTEHNLIDEWEFFRGEFIIIPSKYVFP